MTRSAGRSVYWSATSTLPPLLEWMLDQLHRDMARALTHLSGTGVGSVVYASAGCIRL